MSDALKRLEQDVRGLLNALGHLNGPVLDAAIQAVEAEDVRKGHVPAELPALTHIVKLAPAVIDHITGCDRPEARLPPGGRTRRRPWARPAR